MTRELASPLQSTWLAVNRLANQIEPHNPLRPVLGGGCTDRPLFAFIFINPTPRNISTRTDWKGSALPFVGVPALWRVLIAAGVEGLDQAANTKAAGWDDKLAAKTYAAVTEQRLYLTNLVKHTAPNGDAPSPKLIQQYYPLLIQELRIVKPQLIITFGQLPFKALTGQSVLLRDQFAMAAAGNISGSLANDLRATMVFPCYFPTGRGNPHKAATLLGCYLKALPV